VGLNGYQAFVAESEFKSDYCSSTAEALQSLLTATEKSVWRKRGTMWTATGGLRLTRGSFFGKASGATKLGALDEEQLKEAIKDGVVMALTEIQKEKKEAELRLATGDESPTRLQE